MAQDKVLVHKGNRLVPNANFDLGDSHFVAVSQFTDKIIVRGPVDFDPDPYRTHRAWHSRLTDGPDGTGYPGSGNFVDGRSAGGASGTPVYSYRLELLGGTWDFATTDNRMRLAVASNLTASIEWQQFGGSSPNASAEGDGYYFTMYGDVTAAGHGIRFTVIETTKPCGIGFNVAVRGITVPVLYPSGDLKVMTYTKDDQWVELASTSVGFPAVMEVRNFHEIYANGVLFYNAGPLIASKPIPSLIFLGLPSDNALTPGNHHVEIEDIEIYQTYRSTVPTAPAAKYIPLFAGNAHDNPIPADMDVDLGYATINVPRFPLTVSQRNPVSYGVEYTQPVDRVGTGVNEPNRGTEWKVELVSFFYASRWDAAFFDVTGELFALSDTPWQLVVGVRYHADAGNGFSSVTGNATFVVTDNVMLPANSSPPWTATLYFKSPDIAPPASNAVTMNFPTTSPVVSD